MKKIYTIGYEGRPMEEFFKLLSEKGINHLIDVRTSPYSRRSEFNKENLKDTLFNKSILYKHMGVMGGLGEEDYHEMMKGEEWKESFQEIKDLASKGPTVIMCLEKDPMRCHRRHIADKLKEEGWEVVHLGRGGSWKEKSLDDFAEGQ
ncbi:MAG: DUF488 family protein [Thermoplasmatota archaeon]